MKKTIVFLTLTLFIISCDRDTQISSEEIPLWLRIRIAQDEKEISMNPQSGLDIAAWIRYRFNEEYYFEYYNMLSSLGPITYNYEGCIINCLEEPYIDYMTKRCCKKYVWKGPSYFIEQ